MRLEVLLRETPLALDLALAAGDASVELVGLVDDSRRVEPGFGFVCRVRAAGDRVKPLIADAVERGAAAVFVDERHADAARGATASGGGTSPAVVVAPALEQPEAGEIAEAFHGRPTRRLSVIGVTGTNGKTTVAWLLRHLLRAAGRKAALLGTIETDLGEPGGPLAAELTTPGAVELSSLLARALVAGCDSVVMEVSSHALDQGRVAAVDFDAAVFTNLTGDHLDYHGSMGAYAAAKAKLFESLRPTAWAVVNADDPWARRMVEGSAARVLGTSLQPPPPPPGKDAGPRDAAGAIGRPPATPVRAWAEPLEMAADHSLARFTGPWGSLEVKLPLVGSHNLANAVQALAAASAAVNVDRGHAAALARVPPVPGRLEPVPSARFPVDGYDPRDAPTVLVDYAHTHDALDNVLRALRPLVRPGGALRVVFGCGGDRDATKRPKMAAVACERADAVVLTSDNPRTEDPAAILRDVRAGVPGGFAGVEVVEDRGEAIARCVAAAAAADTVLIAGKGHEDYQVVGAAKRPFDDRREAANALKRRLASRHGVGA